MNVYWANPVTRRHFNVVYFSIMVTDLTCIDNNTSFKVLAYLLIKTEVQNTKGGNSDYITGF
jgi:hypothetical protein